MSSSFERNNVISVCMAVFNGELYVAEQLRSILVQLNDDDEVIIVNDCSTDKSVSIIEKLTDPRITVLQNAVNVGPSRSFERAIASAKGQYIFLSDQDDIWRDDKVEVTCRAFETDASIVVVSDARIVDSDRNIISSSFFALRQSGPGFWRNLYRNGFVGCCMALRSDARAFLIPFPVNAGLHDEWMGLCASIAGRVTFSGDVLIDYRRHGTNVSKMGHGSFGSMVNKRISLSWSILKRLPRIFRWRLTKN